MARKQNDAPIKLIHILPGCEKSVSADSLDSSLSSYRLGIEGSSHSVLNFFKILKKLFPTSLSSSKKASGGLEQSDETEGLSEAQPIWRSRARSWFERLGAFWMGLRSMIFRRRAKHEEDMYSNHRPSPYRLLEGEAENVGLPEVHPEYLDYLGNQGESLSSEVGALRDQVRSQHEDIVRVTSQLTDLKNMVLSQQQVLLHLGKELEGIQLSASIPPPKAPRKSKPRVTKSTKSKTVLPKKRPNDKSPSVEAQL